MGTLTDDVAKANTVTSNVAAILRAAVDAGEAGIQALLAKAEPLAEQLDALLGDDENLVPEPPDGGVPTDVPLSSDDVAAVVSS